MEIILPENLINSLKILSEEERIFIDFPVNISNKLELLQFQIQSAEALFTSYINNTSELANEFNLEKFLTFYANLANEKDFLFKDTVLSIIGTEIYNYCADWSNGINYFLDNSIKKLVFRKISLTEIDNNKPI
jgi:hypothetical protein